MLGLNYGPDGRSAGGARAPRRRRHFRLCAPSRLSRRSQGQAQGTRGVSGRGGAAGKGGREGLRRHGAAAREAAGRARGARLARQAHQSGVARIRLLAVPGRDPHRTSTCRPTRRNRTIADNAAPASTPVRPARSRRPIGSTRGAAFPISRSSTRARFRASFDPAIGNRIYGCDDCLAVCPWNKFASVGREAKLAARADLDAPPLAELARLDDASFRSLFAGGPIKRVGRARFVRNVMIAIGNSKDRALADGRGGPIGRRGSARARSGRSGRSRD